jgi:hypothetical protein
MKFALFNFNDERIEATKGAKGVCPCCGSELIVNFLRLDLNKNYRLL